MKLARQRIASSIAVAAVLCGVTGATLAQSSGEAPSGLRVGRWVVQPSLRTDFERDDNIFRQDEDNQQSAIGAAADSITSLTAAIAAYLPFRNSMLQLDYTGTQVQYDEFEFPSDIAQDFGANLTMNFSTGDVMTLRGQYIDSFTESSQGNDIDGDLAIGPGELFFTGQPFVRQTYEIQFERSMINRPAYLFRWRSSQLSYDDLAAVSFFDFDGDEVAAEYRHPLPGRRQVTAYLQTRRFDNFRIEMAGNQSSRELFREERADQLMLGLIGFLGKGRPYLVRLGYGNFRYGVIGETEFEGLVLFGRWRVPLGSVTSMEFVANRRPLPSGFDGDFFYINEQLTVSLERLLGRITATGLNLVATRNEYNRAELVNDTSNGQTGCPNYVRQDRRARFEPYVTLAVNSRLSFDLTLVHEFRNSNCVNGDFDYTSLNAGVTFGWF